MQSKLINLLELISNNDISCENKDHRDIENLYNRIFLLM